MRRRRAIILSTLETRVYSRFRRNGWLLADQILVSGFNFITSAMLARMFGIHEYGIFSVFYALLLYISCIQAAAISSPMLSLAPQVTDRGQQEAFLRGVAGVQYVFSTACALIFCLVSGLNSLHLLPKHFDSSITIPYAAAIVCYQLQDWLRRRFYVNLTGKYIFWTDCLSYCGQVVVFAVAYKTVGLNLNGAYYAIAFTSLAAFVVGATLADVSTSVHEIKSAAQSLWKLGKGLLIASQFQWLGSQGVLLVVAAEVGMNATAGVRAIVTLVGPLNVVYQLLDNVVPVRTAKIYAERGRDAAVHYLRRASLVIGVLVGVPIATLILFAGPLLGLIFGRAFVVYAPLVLWQGIYVWFALFLRSLQYYHRTFGSTETLARTSMVVSIFALGMALVLVRHHGALGVMIALAAGQIATVLVLAWLTWRGATRSGTDAVTI